MGSRRGTKIALIFKFENEPKMTPKWHPNGSLKRHIKGSQNDHNQVWGPRAENEPKMTPKWHPKWPPNDPQMTPKEPRWSSQVIPGPPRMCLSWLPKGQAGTKAACTCTHVFFVHALPGPCKLRFIKWLFLGVFLAVVCEAVFRHILGSFLEPFWSHFGYLFWS